MSVRLRTIRRQFARLLGRGTVRQFRELQRRAGELEKMFHRLNDELPKLNTAALEAGKLDDPKQLADVLEALSTNHAVSSFIFHEWAEVCRSASKFAGER